MSNAQVNLNIDELKGFLTHIVNNNRFLQAGGKPSVAVEIVGESGIGKTSSALQLANELKLNIVKLNLAQIEELGDLVGFPIRQFQLCPGKQELSPTHKTVQVPKVIQVPVMVKKTITENRPIQRQVMVGGKFEMKEVMMPTKVEVEVEEMQEQTIMEDQHQITMTPVSDVPQDCIWVDEHAIEEYTKQGYGFTGEKRMSYCPPEWIADKQGGGILILDDWNRADIRFIQAVMELVDRQEYISWKMPKDWHILLTANPDNGEYLVNTIDTAQRTRFVSVNLKHDVEVWARWAEHQGIDGRCINFLLMHPELISIKTNPRSITTFFNCISSIPDFAAVDALALIQMIGEGSVGPEFSTMFTTFIHNKLDKLVTPKDILLHDSESYILGELRSCIGRGNDYRADIASVLTTRLINFTVTYSENHTITQKTIERLIKLATDPETFTDDLKYVLVKKVLNGNKQKFQKLMANPEVMTMAMK
jgi:MoxR-like ATPase